MASANDAQQRAYAQQRAVLEQELKKIGVDVFVAPFEIMKSATEEHSYSGWTESVPSLLPKTDAVGLLGGSGESRWMLLVPFDAVLAVCADLLSPVPDVTPPRYATKGWPSARQLQLLEEHALMKKGR